MRMKLKADSAQVGLYLFRKPTQRNRFSFKNSSALSAELYEVLSALRWISLNRHRKNVSKTCSKHYLASIILLLYNSLCKANL